MAYGQAYRFDDFMRRRQPGGTWMRPTAPAAQPQPSPQPPAIEPQVDDAAFEQMISELSSAPTSQPMPAAAAPAPMPSDAAFPDPESPEYEHGDAWDMIAAVVSGLSKSKSDDQVALANLRGITERNARKRDEFERRRGDVRDLRTLFERQRANQERGKPLLEGSGFTDAEVSAMSPEDAAFARRQAIAARTRPQRSASDPDGSMAERAKALIASRYPELQDEVSGMSYEEITKSPALRAILRGLEREKSEDFQRERIGLTDDAIRGRMRLGDRLTVGRELGREERGETRQIEKETRAEGLAAREEARKRRVGIVGEVQELERLRTLLSARKPDERLPAQGSIIERGVIKAKAKLAGGTGMNDEDSRLDTALTAMGLQSYIARAHNAPNSEREQDVAATMYRGNGTVGSAIAAIDARLDAIAQNEETLAPPASPSGRGRKRSRKQAAPATVSDDSDLGVTYE